MCVSTAKMSFFGDLICRPSSSCPRRSPFSAKARFACGRFAGAPLELTLPRFFPSRVVSRSICFVRSKQARTTSSSAPRFAAKRSTSASFSQHESSRQNQLFRPFFDLGIGGAMAHRFQPPRRSLRSRAPLTCRGRALSQCPQCAWHLRAARRPIAPPGKGTPRTASSTTALSDLRSSLSEHGFAACVARCREHRAAPQLKASGFLDHTLIA